ncbi:hypothetical protein CQJ27_06200 [Escherichia sp. E1130]|nr:hypothetical protein CQJ28_07110 [Escherichia sp. E2562]TGC27639.1 hypothetical protein CQJ27_06200 [Escherichia sp. E1130]
MCFWGIMQNKNYTFNKAWVILRGLYAFIVTDFIFGWAIALLMFFQRIKRQARTFVRAFF